MQVRVMPRVLPFWLREVQVPSTPQETRHKIPKKTRELVTGFEFVQGELSLDLGLDRHAGTKRFRRLG
jgi:hypothetical protein